MSKRQIVGGLFQDAAGNPLNGGSITFRLTTDATTGDNKQLASSVLASALLGITGSISGTVTLWPNDQLTPTDTVYQIKVYSSQGQQVWESENVIPSGGGSFDIGTLIPLAY
jgi:hypothetical protein